MADEIRITQKVVEVFESGTGKVRETQKVLEVFYSPFIPTRLTQKVLEVFQSGSPKLRETQKVVEVWYEVGFPGAGIYKLVPGLTHDTLYTIIPDTIDVKIP